MKKFVSCTLIAVMIFFGSINTNTYAFSCSSMISGAIGSIIVSVVPRILYNLWDMTVSVYDSAKSQYKISKYMGFRTPQETINKLEKIVNNESDIKIHGQQKAKKQAFNALSGVVARIDNINRGNKDIKEVRGNIVYLIGPSGTGKTKLCYAIADAFLKHPEKTCIFCHSESITNESELGSQLFKTITTKDIGKKRSKNIFTNSDGLVPKDEESPMLKGLLQWYQTVVIIDEYDKMKLKSAKPGSVINVAGVSVPTGQAGASGEDKSADEILRSIASTGKYTFMNKEVDCSRVLFLITTNETKEELEKNFGIGGATGGGFQRLNVVEFENLSFESCQGVVNDMIDEVFNVLVNNQGPFKLGSITIDAKSMDLMAKYIFNDKIMQGRAKFKLEDKIYSLFSEGIGKECGKDIKLEFKYSEENGEFSFAKSVI